MKLGAYFTSPIPGRPHRLHNCILSGYYPKAINYTIRLTPARRDKLRLLGSEWLSKAIDRTKYQD